MPRPVGASVIVVGWLMMGQTTLCSHRMLLQEDWVSVLECLRAKFENRRWLQSGPNNNKLRNVQQVRPHSRKSHVQELVHVCSKVAVEQSHSIVTKPKNSRDHPIFVCCSKANCLSSQIVVSFSIFSTLSSSSMSSAAVKLSKWKGRGDGSNTRSIPCLLYTSPSPRD